MFLSVILTGSTGFFGAFLLRELLNSAGRYHNAKIVCSGVRVKEGMSLSIHSLFLSKVSLCPPNVSVLLSYCHLCLVSLYLLFSVQSLHNEFIPFLFIGSSDPHTEALRRVRSNFLFYKLKEPKNFQERVLCLAGDLSQTRMGLSEEQYDREILSGKRVLAVFHNAAEVNSAKSYSALRAPNVTATAHMLAVAAQTGGMGRGERKGRQSREWRL